LQVFGESRDGRPQCLFHALSLGVACFDDPSILKDGKHQQRHDHAGEDGDQRRVGNSSHQVPCASCLCRYSL
jgi:hypothetical protein